MRMRYALWLCVLATPAAAQPDTSSGNYMLPYCQAWVQRGATPRHRHGRGLRRRKGTG